MRRLVMRRLVRIGVAALCMLVSVVAFASPAGAKLDGKCVGRGTIDGKLYDPKVQDEATIPRKGKVLWEGSTGVAKKRRTLGEVQVDFPPPIGPVTVGEWGKDGKTSSKPGNTGTYTYDLPSLIAGVEIPVHGTHTEPGIRCSGNITVKIDGTSPLAWGSLALTFVSITGVFFAMQAKPKPGAVF
jgi:hypothetical protein